eukprot:193608_1
MALFEPSQAALVVAYVTTIIWAKYLLCLQVQGLSSPRPPEDATLPTMVTNMMDQVNVDTQQSDDKNNEATTFAKADRWKRIVSNDVESLPIALIIWWACVLTNTFPDVYSIASITWCLFRIIHTIFYAHSMQPWRTYIWFAGKGCEMVGLGLILVSLHQSV